MSKASTWADVTRDKGGQAAILSFDVPRVGALELLMPAGKPDLLKIALAIHKLCKDPGAWQPFVDGDKVYVQSLVPESESGEDRKLMLEKGLIVGNTSVKLKETLGDTTNKDLLVGRIENVKVTAFALEELRKEFGKLGNLMHFVPRVYTGTKVKTGTIDFILDVTEKRHGPKRVYWLDNGYSRDPAYVFVMKRSRFCYFCRGTDHIRKNCTVAPECSNCHSKAHPPHLCKVASPPSDAAEAAQPAEQAISTAAQTSPVDSAAAVQPNNEQLEAATPTSPASSSATRDASVAETEIIQEQLSGETLQPGEHGATQEMEVDDESTQQSTPSRQPSPMLAAQSPDTQLPRQVNTIGGFPTLAQAIETGKSPSKRTADPISSSGEAPQGKAHKRHGSISDNRATPYTLRRTNIIQN